jgi:hypothetical protein
VTLEPVCVPSFRVRGKRERQAKGFRIKAGAASGGLDSKRRDIVKARPTVLAVPPGKRNGREHQDSRRRHLLVKEIVNDPRPSNIAALRPLEDLSAENGTFHQSISGTFPPAMPSEEAGAILGPWRQCRINQSINPSIGRPILASSRGQGCFDGRSLVKSWL